MSAKIYGNEYYQQQEDGTHTKMVWVDSKKNLELVGPEKRLKYGQYIPASELLREERANISLGLFAKQLDIAKTWAIQHPDQRVKLLACTITNKNEVTFPVRAASQKEIERDDRDVRFWLQVLGANPNSIVNPTFSRLATKLYAMEKSRNNRFGYFFGRNGPIYQDVLPYIIEDEVSSIIPCDPLDPSDELIPGVLKMRAAIAK